MAHTILHDSIPTEGRNLTDAEFLELQKVSDCKNGKYYVTQRDGSTKRGLYGITISINLCKFPIT